MSQESRVISYQLFVIVLVLFIALFLQVFIGGAFGWWIELGMATLIVAAFFLQFGELLLLTLLSVLMVNWQPGWSAEILLFALIPVMAYLVKHLSPLSPLPGSLFFIGVSSVALYLIFLPHLFIQHPRIFLIDLVGSLLYGTATYWVIKTQS